MRVGSLYVDFEIKNTDDVLREAQKVAKKLQETINTSSDASQTFKGFSTGASKAASEVQEVIAQVRILRNDTQRAVQAGTLGFDDYERQAKELALALEAVRGNTNRTTKEIAQLATAQRSLDATTAAASGSMSGLGLASQVSLGFVNGLQKSFLSMAAPAAIAFGAVSLVEDAIRLIGQGFSRSIDLSADFEQEIKGVAAIAGDSAREFDRLAGAQGAAFDALADKARFLGATTEASASEAAQGLKFLAQAGFDVNEQLAAIEGTLNLQLVSRVTGEFIELGRSADIVSNILGQFNLSAGQSDRVVDALSKTVTSSNTNIEQLADALNYLGPTAQSLGQPLEETLAIIAKLSDAGLQGSLGTRALGTSLVKLTSPTKEARRLINKLNLEFFDTQGNFKGTISLIAELQTKLKDLTQEQRNAAISTIFGNEAFQELSILLNQNVDELQTYADALVNSVGTAQSIAAERAETLRGAQKALSSAAQELGIAWGDFLTPTLTTLTIAATEFIRLLSPFIAGLSDINVVSNEARTGLEEFKNKSAETKLAIETLTTASSEQGLKGAIVSLANTLDDEGKTALLAFATNTAFPLAAQGDLQGAIDKTIAKTLELQKASLQTELASSRAVEATLVAQSFEIQDQLDALRSMQENSLEPIAGTFEQITRLENALKGVNTEFSAAEQKTTGLVNQIFELNNANELMADGTTSATDAVSSFLDSLSITGAQVDEYTAGQNALASSNENAADSTTGYVLSIASLSTEIAALKKEQLELNKLDGDYEKKQAELAAGIERREKVLEGLRVQSGLATQETLDSAVAVNTYTGSVTKLSEAVAAPIGSLKSLRDELAELKKDLENAATQELRLEIQSNINTLQADIAAIERSLTKAFSVVQGNATISSLAQLSSGKTSDITARSKALLAYNEALKELGISARAYGKETSLEERIQAQKDLINDLLKSFSDNGLDVDFDNKRLKEAIALFDDLQAQLRAEQFPTGSLKALSDEINKLKDSLEAASSQSARLEIQSNIDELQAQYDAFIEGLKQPPPTGSLKALNEELNALAEQLENAATQELRLEIQSNIDALQAQYDSFIDALKQPPPVGSFRALNEEISALNDELENATTQERRIELQLDIDALQAQVDSAQEVLDGLKVDVLKPVTSEQQGSLESLSDTQLVQESTEKLLATLARSKNLSNEARAELLKLGVGTKSYRANLTELIPELEKQLDLLEPSRDLSDENKTAYLGLADTIASLRIELKDINTSLVNTSANGLSDFLRGANDINASLIRQKAILAEVAKLAETYALSQRFTSADAISSSDIKFDTGGASLEPLEAYRKELERLAVKNSVLGNAQDLVTAQISLTQSTITSLIDKGYTPQGKAITELVEKLKVYNQELVNLQLIDVSGIGTGFSSPIESDTSPLDALLDGTKSYLESIKAISPELALEYEKLGLGVDNYAYALENSILDLEYQLGLVDAGTEAYKQLATALAALRLEQNELNEALKDEALDKTLSSITLYSTIATRSLSSLFNTDYTNGNSILDGLSGIAEGLSALPSPIGKIASVVATTLKSISAVIGDLGNGIEETRKKLDGFADSNKTLSRQTLESLSQFEGARERVSRGGLLGFLGFTKESLNEGLFKELEGVANDFAGAFNAALEGADFDTSEILKARLKEALILDPETQALIAEWTLAFQKAFSDGQLSADEIAGLKGIEAKLNVKIEGGREALSQLEGFNSAITVDGNLNDIEKQSRFFQELQAIPTVLASPAWVSDLGGYFSKFGEAVDKLLAYLPAELNVNVNNNTSNRGRSNIYANNSTF